AWACAQRGWKTLGLERHDFSHSLGSSHGHSRIIRVVYYEHPAYVPMAQEAFRRWEELEHLTGSRLLTRCRCANIGSWDSEIVQGVSRAVAEHQLPAERWTYSDIRKHAPALHPAEDMVAIVEERAGWLAVENCVLSMQAQAQAHGATLLAHQAVRNWSASEQAVTVQTDTNEYHAAKLILTAGPWATQLLPQLPLTVMKQMQLWFEPPNLSLELFQSKRYPIFIMDTPLGGFYSIPLEAGPGVKLAQHYGAPELPTISAIHRQCLESDVLPVRNFLQQYVPTLAQAPLAASSGCVYTLTPDRHFVIDVLPDKAQVAVACGFSGHGFKFAPVVGEMLAEMLEGRPRPVIQELFTIQRFRVPVS
ncbi:MAG TPA: N-methyl-L-tryptophan oxidase, partial [Gemmatales bacterium]|nr:N-methyl-L-tryptophan oxidase [Gemmatales bacterium]